MMGKYIIYICNIFFLRSPMPKNILHGDDICLSAWRRSECMETVWPSGDSLPVCRRFDFLKILSVWWRSECLEAVWLFDDCMTFWRRSDCPETVCLFGDCLPVLETVWLSGDSLTVCRRSDCPETACLSGDCLTVRRLSDCL